MATKSDGLESRNVRRNMWTWREKAVCARRFRRPCRYGGCSLPRTNGRAMTAAV